MSQEDDNNSPPLEVTDAQEENREHSQTQSSDTSEKTNSEKNTEDTLHEEESREAMKSSSSPANSEDEYQLVDFDEKENSIGWRPVEHPAPILMSLEEQIAKVLQEAQEAKMEAMRLETVGPIEFPSAEEKEEDEQQEEHGEEEKQEVEEKQEEQEEKEHEEVLPPPLENVESVTEGEEGEHVGDNVEEVEKVKEVNKEVNKWWKRKKNDVAGDANGTSLLSDAIAVARDVLVPVGVFSLVSYLTLQLSEGFS